MLPRSALPDTVTVWTLIAGGTAAADTFRRVVIDRTRYREVSSAKIKLDGVEAATVGTLYISLTFSEPRDNARYVSPEFFNASTNSVFTLRAGLDYVMNGEHSDAAPPDGARRVKSCITRRTPYGAGFLAVTVI